MRTSFFHFATITSSILWWLPSCAGPPSPRHDAIISEAFAPATRLEPSRRADDITLPEDITTRESVSLAQLFAYAELHAPAIATAMAQVEVSRAGQVEAGFTFPSNPTLDLGAGVRASSGAAGFDYEVALSQTLELSGEQRARRHSAALEVEHASSVVDEIRWLTHVEVHRLAWLWLVTLEQREYASLVVDFSAKLEEVTRTQIEAGEISPLDLLVAQADLARARTQLIDVTQQEEVIEARLAAVIGWPPDRVLPALDETLPSPHPPRGLDALLEQLVTHHPSVRKREIAVEARRAQLELARREARPKPSFGASLARESSPGSTPATRAQAAHIGMLTLSIPLTVWRRNQEGIAMAQASATLADRERAQTVRQLESELRIASAAVDAALATLDLYTLDIIPQLRTHFELLERAYELGEVDIHQVSQTRERLLEAMTHYSQARMSYFDRAATLEGLVGTEQWGEPLSTKENP